MPKFDISVKNFLDKTEIIFDLSEIVFIIQSEGEGGLQKEDFAKIDDKIFCQWMKPEERFLNLYNKSILKYAQLARRVDVV